jgi:hypothetical protein
VADSGPLEGLLHDVFGCGMVQSQHGQDASCGNALFWMGAALSGVVSTEP